MLFAQGMIYVDSPFPLDNQTFRCDLTKKYYQAILVDMKSAENALVQKLKLADHKVTSLTLELSQIKQLSSRREDKLKLELSILEEKNSLLTALLDEHSRGRAKAEESLKLHAKSTEEVEALREKVRVSIIILFLLEIIWIVRSQILSLSQIIKEE